MNDKQNIWRTETRQQDKRFEAAKAAMEAILRSIPLGSALTPDAIAECAVRSGSGGGRRQVFR